MNHVMKILLPGLSLALVACGGSGGSAASPAVQELIDQTVSILAEAAAKTESWTADGARVTMEKEQAAIQIAKTTENRLTNEIGAKLATMDKTANEAYDTLVNGGVNRSDEKRDPRVQEQIEKLRKISRGANVNAAIQGYIGDIERQLAMIVKRG